MLESPNNSSKEFQEKKGQNLGNQNPLNKSFNIQQDIYLATRSQEKVENIYNEFSSLLNEERFNDAIIKISELIKNDIEFRNTPYYIVYEEKLRRNLDLITRVSRESEATIIMAFKASGAIVSTKEEAKVALVLSLYKISPTIRCEKNSIGIFISFHM